MSGRPGLGFEQLHVTVPDGSRTRVLLDHIDLEIPPGEVLVVTGGSGSGKSTLLAAAGLLRRPDSGEVRIDGVPTSGLSERRRTTIRREQIAIVYQAANLLPSLTAIEQLELVGHINREKRAEVRERAEALLAEVGLSAQADQLPGKMSGGERQRVGIGRALMAQPSVLLADEPTASLDPELSAQVCALLAEQTAKRDLATVLVSHDETPLAWARRHLHLEAGSLTEIPTSDPETTPGPG